MALILDLDNTLVYCQKSSINWDIKVSSQEFYKINYRPHLSTFLSWVQDYFIVNVWSAGTKEYVTKVVQKLTDDYSFKPVNIYTRDDMVIVPEYPDRKVKLLSDPSMLIVDDNHQYIAGSNCEQWLPIIPWVDDPRDQELLKMKNRLEEIMLTRLVLW